MDQNPAQQPAPGTPSGGEVAKVQPNAPARERRFGNRPQGRGGNYPRRGGSRPQVREEFNEKVLDLRRVTRVVAGGKRMRFRTTIVLGDGKGRIGIGIGKGQDVQDSIGKAKTQAKKNIIRINLDKRTIPHEVEAKFSAAWVRLKPAVLGHGLKAGGAVRVVLSLAGVKDIVAKCLGRTPNKLTNALATIEALKQLRSPKEKIKTRSREAKEAVPAV